MLESLCVDHVGIVVQDIKVHYEKHFEHMFPENALGPLIHDPLQRVTVAFIHLSGGCIELIEPSGSDSPVTSFLKMRPAGLYHICFGVKNLDEQIVICKSNGMMIASPPKPAVAFYGKRVAFVMGRDRLLWELLETSKG